MNFINKLIKKLYSILNNKNQRNNLYQALTFFKKKKFYPENNY